MTTDVRDRDLKTTCPACGPVEVPCRDAVLDTERNVYVLVCPLCGRLIQRKYNTSIFAALRSAGVLTIEEVPDRLLEVLGL